jgi:putative Holliday junction resolvase
VTAEGFRRGIRIGIDVGSVRVGVARTDPDGVLAVPVATLARPKAVAAPRTDLTGLADLVAEYEPLEVVVGLPLALDGTEGPAAQAVRAYVADLTRVLAERGNRVPVRLVDERMSTAQATRGLQAAGRDSRTGRAVVDQAAAVIIVQSALDAERATGAPPGALIDPGQDLA